MTYTSHGHHIPGTTKDDEFGQISRARCGGTILCSVCAKDADAIVKALDKDIDVGGFFEAPPVISMDAVSKAKLFVVGARNNVVNDEKDQITVDDLILYHFQQTPYGWVAQLTTYQFTINGLFFSVEYTQAIDTTVVETLIKIEHDVFSQEGN